MFLSRQKSPFWIWSGMAVVCHKGSLQHLDNGNVKVVICLMSCFGYFDRGFLFFPKYWIAVAYCPPNICSRTHPSQNMGSCPSTVGPLSPTPPLYV